MVDAWATAAKHAKAAVAPSLARDLRIALSLDACV